MNDKKQTSQSKLRQKTKTDTSPEKTHSSVSQITRETQTTHFIQVTVAIVRKSTITTRMWREGNPSTLLVYMHVLVLQLCLIL